MSLRKSLRRSLRSSYKVKSSDEVQVKPSDSPKVGGSERLIKSGDVAKMGTNECSKNRDVGVCLNPDEVTLRLDCSSAGPSGSGVTLEASNSSFESHEDLVAAGGYQSSGSEDDLVGVERQDICPDNALYEFLYRACALMVLENDDIKTYIEQQQPEEKKELSKGDKEMKGGKKEEGNYRKSKKEKQNVRLNLEIQIAKLQDYNPNIF
ncbi:hypothetical protein SK128_024674 [Halocaridina rubra]|uniref:Uncharacterized protein n=1 Tax=Halocaridina rubra TaxID=373956 RepID=A0AAN8XI61_HALRR